MRALWLFGLVLLMSGCWKFADEYAARCDAGTIIGCGNGSGDGGCVSSGAWDTTASGPVASALICPRGAWCWETPRGPGGGVFRVLFSADGTVFAGGSAHTLLAWEPGQQRWRATGISPEGDAGLTHLDAVPDWIQSVAVASGTYLLDERGDVYRFEPNRTLSLFAQDRGVARLAVSVGNTLLMLTPTGILDEDFQSGSRSLLGGGGAVFDLLEDGAGCVVVQESSPGAGDTVLVNCNTGARFDAGAEPLFFERLYERAATPSVYAREDRFLELVTSTPDWAPAPHALPTTQVAAMDLHVTAATWNANATWLVGDTGFVFNPGTGALLRPPNYDTPPFRAVTTTSLPDGGDAVWALGESGAMFVSSPQVLIVDRGFNVNDLVSTGSQHFAFAGGHRLRRTSTGWNVDVAQREDTEWLAGAAVGDATFMLGADGVVYRWRFAGGGEPVPVAQVSAPISRGRLVAQADGQLLIGAGTQVSRLPASTDGGATPSFLVGQGSDGGPDVITGLVATCDGRVFAGGPSGTGGGVWRAENGGWAPVAGFERPVNELALCPDGRLLIVGQHLFERFDPTTGTLEDLLANSSAPANFTLISVWCDASNRAWALSELGFVLRWAEGMPRPVREDPGFGPNARVIRGNANEVMIGGFGHGVMTRPLP